MLNISLVCVKLNSVLVLNKQFNGQHQQLISQHKMNMKERREKHDEINMTRTLSFTCNIKYLHEFC